MKRTKCFILVVCLVPSLTLAQRVSVSTDRSLYQQGDSLYVAIQYLNETDTTITLGFPSSCQFNYCIDSSSCWGEQRGCLQVLTSVQIGPRSAYTWNSSYLPPPLSPGRHRILGWVGGLTKSPFYGSDTASFDVDSLVLMPLQLLKGWNLLSVPPHTPLRSLRQEFPTAVSPLFYFDVCYKVAEEIPAGKGFWVKSDSTSSVSILLSALTFDSIDVVAGWNLISTLSVPVLKDSVRSSPPGIIISQFFSTPRCDWALCPALTPGMGYWVKIKQAGKLILRGM